MSHLLKSRGLENRGRREREGERKKKKKGRISHAVSPTALVYHCVEFPAQVVFPAVVKLMKCTSRTSAMVETKNGGILAHTCCR
jgi:hypothetical protein